MKRLEEYQLKRNFQVSPEPVGKIKPDSASRFVIQKHWARRLHYDLRLEHRGVLKSWAIPKEPLADPKVIRLAIEVEDHPAEYLNFEGIIPKDNYGAGTVIIWDKGNYLAEGAGSFRESEKLISAGLKKGHLSLIFNGQRLKGSYDLFKIKTGKMKVSSWLLRKKKDKFAQEKKTSVSDLDSQKNGDGNVWFSNSELNAAFLSAPKIPLPHKLKPMLAISVKQPFDDPNFLYEIKWDGYRALAEIENKTVNLYSRNFKNFNAVFPSVVDALEKLPFSAIFDGEIVVFNEQKLPDFNLIQNYALTKKGNVRYCLFDILYLAGRDLRLLPLAERKKILAQIIPTSADLQVSEHIFEFGKDFFKAAVKLGLEGIVGKKINSKYQSGKRSLEWLKIPNYFQEDFVIGGYTEPQGSRKNIGALVLGFYQKDKLYYTGNVGGGFSENDLEKLKIKFDQSLSPECPFENPPKISRVHWVKPYYVASVRFKEITEIGLIRQPIFMGLRTDKNPKEVLKENLLHATKNR